MNQSIINITEDFQLFLTFLKSKKEISLTNAMAKLKSKYLFQMNELIHNKANWVSEKHSQTRFSTLNFFFWIAIYGKLAKKLKNSKNENILILDEERVADFLAINSSEQYCFILQTFWCELNWEKIDDNRSIYFIHDGLTSLTELKPNHKYKIKNSSCIKENSNDRLRLMYTPFTEFFACLGWYEIEPDLALKKYDTYELPYKMLLITDLGKSIGKILSEERPLSKYNKNLQDEFDDEEEVLNNSEFLNPFKVLFEEPIENVLSIPPHEFIVGNFIFKLQIDKKIHRVISISSEDLFQELHEIIIASLDFDNDHLFSFHVDDKEIFGNPFGEEDEDDWTDYSAHTIQLGKVPFFVGQEIEYRFDFGANWRFNLTLLAIDTISEQLLSAEIIESIGEAPIQYDWDDEDED